MKVVLSEYDPIWPELFKQEKQILFANLSSVYPIIEHIGSTAVPDLLAKPIIDIMIGLADFKVADSLIPLIQELGYTYFDQYEDVMPHRRFFKKLYDGIATHHIHIVEVDSKFWIRHLLFRDYLRRNQAIALEYAELKQNLAQDEWEDSNDFADAKGDFIESIQKKAGFLPEPS